MYCNEQAFTLFTDHFVVHRIFCYPLQLADHYANCMKLSAENKINVKNAFSLGLIDYMAEMVRKKAPGMDNFQVRA